MLTAPAGHWRAGSTVKGGAAGGAGVQVWLCRERKTGMVMALKKLRKAEMVRRGQVDHVKAERNVLAEVHHPYIVRLYYSFQVGAPPARPLLLPQSGRHPRHRAHLAVSAAL